MVRKSAKQAVSDVLKLELEEKQSQELYYSICNFLMAKDDLYYVDIVKFKYALLSEDFDQELIDYFVMEFILEKMRKKHDLILSSLTYLVTCKS